MTSVSLKIVDRSLTLDGIETRWLEAANWPFPGTKWWDDFRACPCGNHRFLVTRHTVEDTDESGSPVRLATYRRVCGRCIEFYRGEMVLGEVDYMSKIAYVYQVPEPAPADGRVVVAAGNSNCSINKYIPDNIEWMGVGWFDAAQFAAGATEKRPEPTIVRTKRGPSRKRRQPDGPTFEGM